MPCPFAGFLSVSDSLICVSAQLPHPFQPNVHVQMWWQETKHPCAERDRRSPPLGSAKCSIPVAASAGMHLASAATMHLAQAAPAVASPRRGSQGWGSSSDEGENHQGTGSNSHRLPTPWISCSSQPPPPPDDQVPTTSPVSLPPGFQSPLPKFKLIETDRVLHFMSAGCFD